MRAKPEKSRVRPAAIAIFALLLFSSLAAISTRASYASEPQRLILLEEHALAQAKQRLQTGDASLASALNKLKRDADRTLAGGPFSIAEKEVTPPSGDKHDYLSIAPYWWPNPNTSNGLPYIRRDGQVNPERDQTSDRRRLDQMIQAVKTLGLGYYLIGRDEYATHAVSLIHVWFLDPTTKMNPHLKYAQAVPGRNIGRAAGIIETHNLPELIDSVALLSAAKSWTRIDQQQLREWFITYLNWLTESSVGKAAANAKNNHGTWYAVQVASYALFVGRTEQAKNIMSEFATKHIAKQIEPDGRQPGELARTQSWNYSVFNLEALFNAAAIAEKLKIDLWNFRTVDGRSIRSALDWLLPFATEVNPWPYKQLSAFQPEKLAPLLRRAALRYRDPGYEQALGKISKVGGDERWLLIYAKVAQPQ